MKRIAKAIILGFSTEAVGMSFAVLTGSYATPVFISPLSESGLDIPGRLLHFPGFQLFYLLFSVLHSIGEFDDWHLGWWWQLFWLFTFQATFWSIVWFVFLRLRSRERIPKRQIT